MRETAAFGCAWGHPLPLDSVCTGERSKPTIPETCNGLPAGRAWQPAECGGPRDRDGPAWLSLPRTVDPAWGPPLVTRCGFNWRHHSERENVVPVSLPGSPELRPSSRALQENNKTGILTAAVEDSSHPRMAS